MKAAQSDWREAGSAVQSIEKGWSEGSAVGVGAGVSVQVALAEGGSVGNGEAAAGSGSVGSGAGGPWRGKLQALASMMKIRIGTILFFKGVILIS